MYTSLDKIGELSDKFSYIREDAELQGFKYQSEAEDHIHNKFKLDFPEFTSMLSFELSDDIWIDYDISEDLNEYNVYISFSKIAMEALKKIYTEY